MAIRFDEVLNLLHDVQSYEYIEAASIVILLYDYILSFNDELRYIWRARWNMGKWLYLFIRYNATIEFSINTFVSLAPGVRPPSFCSKWYFIDGYIAWVDVVAVSYLLSLRTSALYPDSKWLNLFTTALCIACFGAAAILIAVQAVSPRGGIDSLPNSPAHLVTGCLYKSTFFYLHYVWICHIVFEAWITCLTLIKAAEQLRAGTLHLTPLVKVLYRDGFLYAFVILGIGIINLTLWISIVSMPLAVSIISVYRVFICVMGSHIILTLRSKREYLARLKRFDSPGMTRTGNIEEDDMHPPDPLSGLDGTEERSSGCCQRCEEMDIRFANVTEIEEDETGSDVIELSHLSRLWSTHSENVEHRVPSVAVARTEQGLRQ